MDETSSNRALTDAERSLVRWMLEHGKPGAQQYVLQLDRAEVTDWRCPCGCASFHLLIVGQPKPSGPMHVLADHVFGDESSLSGVFVFEQGGILAGLEVYGLAADAPKVLPAPASLRPFSADSAPKA